MPENDVPSAEELLQRATELVPVIKSKAEWSEENRRLHDDVVEAMAKAGIFDMRRPVRYGGYETETRTLVDVLSTLALGDGSTAWNAAVWSIGNWMACLFPDHVQDEIFAEPGVRVCAVLSPTASAVPAEGGLIVNGRWQFISGARHSGWQCIIAMAPTPDGASQWPVCAMVPVSELEIVDDWYTSGLAATGSATTVATNLFVPEDRVLPLPAVLMGQYASQANASSGVFTAPLIPTGCAGFVGVAVGLANAARSEFLERLPGRKITYTDYENQGEAPLTHLQVAEATLKIDEAQFHAYRIADLLDAKGAGGEEWKLEERVRTRVSLGRAFDLVKDAVDVISTASGGSSIYRSVPIQRIQRDVQALNLHALMHPNTNYELYGRVLCGLEPNTMYL